GAPRWPAQRQTASYRVSSWKVSSWEGALCGSGPGSVQPFDGVGKLLGDDAALDFQRGRQLATLLRQLMDQQIEPLHLLELREVGVQTLDLGCVQRPHFGQGHQILSARDVQAAR